jgi:predicted RNA binding protein YcfA (HicA-like mRNA interferase family)
MPEIPIIKAKNFYKFLLKYGCVEISVKGSHHKIHNPKTLKISIVAIHSNKDFSKGAFLTTLNQLGIDINAFLEFLKNN